MAAAQRRSPISQHIGLCTSALVAVAVGWLIYYARIHGGGVHDGGSSRFDALDRALASTQYATPLPEATLRQQGKCDDPGFQHARCGRRLRRHCNAVVVRGFADANTIAGIGAFAEAVMRTAGGGHGGVTLADVHGGIVSAGERFADLFKIWNSVDANQRKPLEGSTYTYEDALTYRDTVRLIRDVAWRYFLNDSEPLGGRSAASASAGEDKSTEHPDDTATTTAGTSPLRLASPAFISLITNAPPRSPNDEYWHPHVDIDQYPSFDVTTLLYLSSAAAPSSTPDGAATVGAASSNGGGDATTACDGYEGSAPCFCGGEFLFLSGPQLRPSPAEPVYSYAPMAGDLLMFTSGREHPHRVAKVTCGARMAMTTAFTCSPKSAQVLDVDDNAFMRYVLARGKRSAELA
jgi:hypothetical protein